MLVDVNLKAMRNFISTRIWAKANNKHIIILF